MSDITPTPALDGDDRGGYEGGEPLLMLASQSEGRKHVLRQAGIAFTSLDAGVDEQDVLARAMRAEPMMSAQDQPLVLARAKAEAGCAASEGGFVVLGCDSMLEFEGALLGKPLDIATAKQRWAAMRGASALLHTGHWIVDDRDPDDGGTGATFGQTRSTRVHFANVSDAEIDAYVDSGEPLWVAGAFTIDGRGAPFIERIEGDHTGVIGVSLPLLRLMLHEIGLEITDLWHPPTPQ